MDNAEQNKKKGYIMLWRSMFEHELWHSEPFTRAQAWIDIIANANYRDSVFFVRGNKVEVKRGQLAKPLRWYCDRWNWSRGKVERYFDYLEAGKQIDQHKSHVITVIEVKNYNKYQPNEQTESETDKQTDRQHKNKGIKGNNKPPISPLQGESSVSATQYDLKKEEQAKIVFDQTTIEQIAMAVKLTIPEMRRAYHYWKDDRIEKHREIDTLDALRAGFRRYLRNARDKWKSNKNPMA
jgi:hypothetical protein